MCQKQQNEGVGAPMEMVRTRLHMRMKLHMKNQDTWALGDKYY